MEQDSFEIIVEYVLEHQKSFYRLAYSSVGNQQASVRDPEYTDAEELYQKLGELPVIGELAKILTVRSYEKKEEDIRIDVEVPGVELGETDHGLSGEINAQIEKMVRQYENEALERAKEYKQAFLETGGTEEEWAKHDIRIHVWYEIKSQTEDVLSFVVKGTESWTSAYTESRYYNLDLKKNEFLSLSDLLGEDYIARANESIGIQIKERTQAGDFFFSAEEGGFSSIGEDTAFYVNEKSNPVIIFEKYAIAPGAMDEVEVYAMAIKEAVADQDLEKLADLTGFPVYVGLEDAGVVETREEFLALNPKELFSEEMIASIEKADLKELSPSMAGFTLMDYQTEGSPAITFGLVDGKFRITGINY